MLIPDLCFPWLPSVFVLSLAPISCCHPCLQPCLLGCLCQASYSFLSREGNSLCLTLSVYDYQCRDGEYQFRILPGDRGLQGGYNPENYTPGFVCVRTFFEGDRAHQVFSRTHPSKKIKNQKSQMDSCYHNVLPVEMFRLYMEE